VCPGVRFNLTCEGVTISSAVSEGDALANAVALLSFEGPNEPNNFPITYNGATGGGPNSWIPVVHYQRDLYAANKANPTVKNYPVLAVSVGGAENNNVGMQFLTIPKVIDSLKRIQILSGASFTPARKFSGVLSYRVATAR
jgi:hypothetical protein